MAVMTLRLSTELHAVLHNQAKTGHISANEYVVRLLATTLSARQSLRDQLIEQIAVDDAETFARLAEK